MSIINLLPDHIANQIAAGEVIQRPASVVKELMENSIDAGAQFVQLHVKDAGKTLIQVVDDGDGMTPEDAVKNGVDLSRFINDLHHAGMTENADATLVAERIEQAQIGFFNFFGTFANFFNTPDTNIGNLENIFTMLPCIINKIPLFICGKPGCSKSLSIQIIFNAKPSKSYNLMLALANI
jgi:DNA mismatch repair protein MutL